MKVGIFVTHPVQYQVPLWAALSQVGDWEVKVYYFSNQGVGDFIDPGFGKKIAWDIPLLEGYDYQFLSELPIQEERHFRIKDVNSLLKGEGFDVILLHGYTHIFARQIIRRRNKFHYRVILHGEFTDMPRHSNRLKAFIRDLYLRWFYRNVDHFCPIGLDAIDHLKKRRVTETQLTVTPYSVDDQLFESQRLRLSQADCREKLGIKSDDMVFLFSGKLMPRKQPLLLAAAAEQLVEKYSNLVMIYLGDGEQFDELKLRLSPVLGSRLFAPGFVNQSELGQYYCAANVFVLPSNYDTWGLVVNEAMHFGLPCITSNKVGSRRDLIISGKTGLVFNSGDSSELADCMQYFLENPDETRRMGENAHSHIQGFAISKTVKGLTEAIKSVASINQAATNDQ